MRSSQLKLSQYNTDKVANGYLNKYDEIFEHLTENKISLLELGVHKGGSLFLWRDYFPMAKIVGIDMQIPKGIHFGERIHVFEGSQTDHHFLSHVAHMTAPDGFDIIIDDASHIGQLTKCSFWHLFENHLKYGGFYVIEDWGTGYWDDWPDGKSLSLKKYTTSIFMKYPQYLRLNKIFKKLHLKYFVSRMRCHNYGMVGFVKQLIDEQAAHDVTRKKLKGVPERKSKFENMIILPSLVFIKKASQ